MVKKRIKSLICILMMVTMVFCNTRPMVAEAASKSKSNGNDYAEGDSIYFGSLDGNALYWTVLKYDSSTGVALLLLKNAVSSKTVSDFQAARVKELKVAPQDRGYENWYSSAWRTFLNNTFYKNAFNKNQQSKIQTTAITKASQQDDIMKFFHDATYDAAYTRDGKKYDMDLDIYDNQKATSDKLFFLSYDEYATYHDLIPLNDTSAKWPLRTNSYYAKNRVLCVDVANAGFIDSFYYYENIGIKPAMYVKIKDIETEDKTLSSETTNNKTNTSTNATTTNKAEAKPVIKRRSYANNAKNTEANLGNINLPEEDEHDLTPGEKTQITLDLSYLNFSNKNYSVTYSSSDNDIFVVDSTGAVTAGTKSGSAELKVRMKKSNGQVYNMSCRINVE